MVKRFGCDFFWHWVGGVPWGEGAREDCWCDYDRSVYKVIVPSTFTLVYFLSVLLHCY